MSKKKIVYWTMDDSKDRRNWNLLYEEPENLLRYLKRKQDKQADPDNNFFICPAFVNTSKNIFFFRNPMHSKFSIHEDSIIPHTKSFINSQFDHKESVINNKLFTYGMHFYFFAEESLEMTLSSPFFSNSQHLQYGSLVPGTLDISKWFRRVNLEFNLWEGVKEMEIKEGEPLVYFKFNTDEQVVLQRFSLSDRLYNIGQTTSTSSKWESRVPLKKRYDRFMKSRTNDLVLKEIKENIF